MYIYCFKNKLIFLVRKRIQLRKHTKQRLFNRKEEAQCMTIVYLDTLRSLSSRKKI